MCNDPMKDDYIPKHENIIIMSASKDEIRGTYCTYDKNGILSIEENFYFSGTLEKMKRDFLGFLKKLEKKYGWPNVVYDCMICERKVMEYIFGSHFRFLDLQGLPI